MVSGPFVGDFMDGKFVGMFLFIKRAVRWLQYVRQAGNNWLVNVSPCAENTKVLAPTTRMNQSYHINNYRNDNVPKIKICVQRLPVFFLPPNTTSLIQLLNQAIIKCFKT